MALEESREAPSPAMQAALLTVITILVLFLRRPDQFLHPYIWVEEGKYVLPDYLDNGPWILTHPLAGYSQLASKIIAYAAFKTSILWAPEIALALVVAFTCAVIVAVALSPTHLKWPFACAIATLLIPTDAEAFAVSAYAFWWAGILLLVALLWDAERGRQWLRWFFILLGGLSAPIVGTIAVLLGLRAIVERRLSEVYAMGFAIVASIGQVLAMRAEHLNLHTEALSFETIKLVAAQYIGGFFYSRGGPLLGFAVLALLIGSAWIARARLDRYFLLLVLTFLLISVSVSLRMPISSFNGIDQFDAGPRYFFYPFILLSWIMVWIAAVSQPAVRYGIAAAFVVALLMAGTALSRRHDAFNWHDEILACARSDTYEVPLHYIGHANQMWHVTLTGPQCQALIDKSLF